MATTLKVPSSETSTGNMDVVTSAQILFQPRMRIRPCHTGISEARTSPKPWDAGRTDLAAFGKILRQQSDGFDRNRFRGTAPPDTASRERCIASRKAFAAGPCAAPETDLDVGRRSTVPQ